MKVYFYTLGCKVNQYETRAMQRLLEAEGMDTAEWSPGDTAAEADVLVINSCTVTGESDRKLRQLLRRCRREYPQAVLVLTGCMPQAFPEAAAALGEADIVLGNADRAALGAHIRQFLSERVRQVDIPAHPAVIEPLCIDRFQERTRAFVKIEDGCNNFCSYCIIPYARGRERSKPREALREELAGLAAAGYREVVLVGINLTAYGKEWGGSIADAAEVAEAVGGIERVRLGSLEPDAVTPAVIARLAACSKLCPQFHLSLQSGCDATLRRMNRHYTAAQYAAVCADLRRAFPDGSITTDIMVGFPGEDEEEFAASLAFVEGLHLARGHVFAYSRRAGTVADRAERQVPTAVKTERSHRMIAVCEAAAAAFAAGQIGRTVEVLLESGGADGWRDGYSPAYLPVRVHTDRPAGETVTVHITRADGGICYGEVIG